MKKSRNQFVKVEQYLHKFLENLTINLITVYIIGAYTRVAVAPVYCLSNQSYYDLILLLMVFVFMLIVNE